MKRIPYGKYTKEFRLEAVKIVIKGGLSIPEAGRRLSLAPAAVCILTESRDEGWMQSVAGEMNLSETAFLWKKNDGYSLRWFTPSVEIDLCGHATLISAHVLWESGQLETGRPVRSSLIIRALIGLGKL